MIEVCPRLFVGNEHDYEWTVRDQDGWRVIHACKEPYHRQALGYAGRGAPKQHPEYLIALRGNRLILNLVDAPDPSYIPREIIEAALDFIHEGLQADSQVLVHCNEGFSRAPSIVFLYLISKTRHLPAESLDVALKAFSVMYPPYSPAAGMFGFVRMHFDAYRQRIQS